MTFALSPTVFGLIIAIVLFIYYIVPLEFSVSMYFSLLLSAELEIDSVNCHSYGVLHYFNINVGCWSTNFLHVSLQYYTIAAGCFSWTLFFPQYGFIAWLLSTCVGLLLSFLRYATSPTTFIFVFDFYTLSIFAS